MSYNQELLFLRSAGEHGFRPLIAEIVEIEGALQHDRLAAAVAALPTMFESLRTGFFWSEEHPAAVAIGDSYAALHFEHLRGFPDKQAFVEKTRSAMTWLDHSRARNVACVLAQIGEARWLWVCAINHIVTDGWSQQAYGRAFSRIMRGEAPPAPRVAHASTQYAIAQRRWFETPDAQDQLFWSLSRLSRAKRQRLPIRPARAKGLVATVTRFEYRIVRLHDQLVQLARSSRCSLFTLFFAAVAFSIARRTNEHEASVLSLTSGRTLPGGRSALGAFYNSIVVSMHVPRGADPRALIGPARSVVLETLQRQEVPLSISALALQKLNGEELTTKFPITFNVIEHAFAQFHLPGCRAWEIDTDNFDRPQFAAADTFRRKRVAGAYAPLNITICEFIGEYRIWLDSRSDLLDEEDSFAFLREFIESIAMLCGDPTTHRSGASAAPVGLISDCVGKS